MYKILFAVLFSVICVKAQTLDQILKIAEENSPYLKANLFKIKATEGQLFQAKAVPNPQMNIEFGRIISQTESGLNLTGFSIQQQLRLWGEKKFAINSANLKKKAQEFYYDFQKNILYGQIYTNFYNALYYKQLINLKNQEYNLYKEILAFIKKSYKLGESTQLDLLRAQRELDFVKLQLDNLNTKYKTYLNTLSALAGENISDIEGDFFQISPLYEINLANHPLLKYYDLISQSIDEEIKRYKALAKPKISIGFVASEDEVDLGKYDFGLSINSTIPVFYKNKGQIISAIYRKKTNIQQKQQQILKLKADLKTIEQQYQVIKKQLKTLQEQTLPKVQETLKLGEKSFKNNVISFFEYSSINKQYFDTVAFKLQLLNQLHLLKGDYIKIGGFNQ
ncbi:MAG: TolC family protein [Aquificae bacterium]|nr:TolC family protein [Aquificota bacterium]